MATIVEYPTTSDDEESLEDEKTTSGSFRNGEFQGRLFKWTNYLHGWQERYLILRHGFLNYYKNEFDITLGCRGALSVRQAAFQPHEFDDCRFDIRVSDSVWYLRAHNSDDRERWMQALEDHKQMCKSESGYGSETSLRRHPSLGSLASTASTSVASTGSFRKDRNLKEKLSELETYRELLAQQVATLQTYFDACANAVTKGFEPYQKEYENENDLDFEDSIDKNHGTSNELIKSSLSKQRIDKLALGDHAAMAIDFKGEALTFKATTDGVIHNLSFCIELMQKREDIWKKKHEKELERRKKFQDLYMKIVKQKIPALGSPDAEEGPHSALKEDEFYDALDQSLDRIDREMDDFQRTVSIVYFYTFITHSKSTVSIKDKNKMYKIMY
jgi:collagen type IV alpha-3-binding protein